MKDHQKNLPPAGHQPPPPPPDKHHKHEKHRRRGPGFGFIFFLLLILAVAALVVLWKMGLIHFGRESGDGAGSGGSSAVTSAGVSDTSKEEESTVIEIRINVETIYFDGTKLANAEEVKAKITEIGNKKTYNLVDDSAIKATYDEVKAVLTELEKALDIKVNYIDQ